MTHLGPSDLVGTLLDASPETLTVRRRDGSVAEVAVDSVAAGRVVPPGPARRIPVDELERVAALGWRPLEEAPLGGWTLRASAGFTRRGNSALAVGDPGRPLAQALDAVTAWYGERGLRPRVSVTPGSAAAELLALLDERGWVEEAPTQVMTAELGPVLRAAAAGAEEVGLDDEPDDAWLAAWRADTPDALPDVARPLLVNHPDVAFASIRAEGRCTAIARVCVDGRWAGLSSVEVTPDRRGRGLAGTVSVAALRWAVQRRARFAYLQVVTGNAAARAVYDRMGFTVHHDYVYRTAPSVTSDG